MQPKVRRALATLAWVIFGLIAIDIAINVFFRYPTDPLATNPNQLQLYFEYGRSSEGKLDRMTGTDRTNSAPITLAGWYDPLETKDYAANKGSPIVTFYGMSHAVRLAEAFDRTADHYATRSVGAPGATANWSYGAFLRDRGGGGSKAAVLSLMTANLPMINTMTPHTWNVSFPMPYTADRFYVKDGKLEVVHPPYTSFEQYVATFRDPTKWDAASKSIAAHDTMYNDFLVRRTWLDNSSIFRLIRRAYGQREERAQRNGVVDRNGFNADAEQIKVANAIVRDFAAEARKDGIIPVIYIVNSFGYSDSLFRALKQTLDDNHIPYLSSHTLVSPDDPRGYLPDSHFTDANDERLARALSDVIDAAAAEQGKPMSTLK